jgi:Ca2+-binding RTX toxin-like protein
MDINGTSGKDTLQGTDQDDTITAGADDDVVNAGAGDDLVLAGSGNDYVTSGSGNDTLFGDAGTDTLDYTTGPLAPSLVVEYDPEGTGAGQALRITGTNSFGAQTNDLVFGFERIILGSIAGGALEYDGAGYSLVPLNNAPDAGADTTTTDEDTPVTIDVLANDTDLDGETLTVTSVTQGANGTVTIEADGTVTYTPDPDFNGADSFTYEISDGNGGIATGTVDVTVEPVNDDPVAVADAATTDEDVSVNIPALGNDEDVDGDPLVIASARQGAHGTVAIQGDGTLTYTPDPDFNGADSFTYQVSDGNGGTDTVTVNVTITPVNDAPSANDDGGYETDFETPVDIAAADLLANDEDGDPELIQPLTVTGLGAAINGTAALVDGTITFTPDDNFTGGASFVYFISDDAGGTASGTVFISVGPNRAPRAEDDAYTVAEDQVLVVSEPGVLGNDSDEDDDTLTAQIVIPPSDGTATIDTFTGELTYTPDENFNGEDSIFYLVSDGNGGFDFATVNITVTPANDDPEAEDDTATTDEDSAVSIDVIANDEDIDEDELTVASVTQGANGSVAIEGDGTLTYTPDEDFNGTDSFTYEISDGSDGTATATVIVTVDPVNDDPEATDDTAATDEDEAVNIAVLANDTDLDGDDLTVDLVTQGANGSVAIEPDGTVTYTPDADFNGTDSFTYEISDGNGGTRTATVNVIVNPVNDDPVAERDFATTEADTPVSVDVLANDTDVDGDSLTVISVTQGANGTVAIAPDGTVSYAPSPGFQGNDTFSYDISDGNGGTATGTVRVSVDPDIVIGTPQDDTLEGGPGDSTVIGESGDDIIIASRGEDRIDGSFGDDTFRFPLGAAGTGFFIELVPDGFELEDRFGLQMYIEATGNGAEAWLFDVETLEFSSESETIEVALSNDLGAYDPDTVIDLGSGDEDTLTFDDTSFSSSSTSATSSLFGLEGVFLSDGYVGLADPALTDAYLKTNVLLKYQPDEVLRLLQNEDPTTQTDPVRFINVDNITLTDKSDRVLIQNPEGEDPWHSGTGEILGLGGTDVFFVDNMPDGDFTVDGGEGNDILIVKGSEGTTVVGGLGRDFIINASPGGNSYGDTFTGETFDATGRPAQVPETGENADHFWFVPDTTIHDPQPDDILSFYGVPLTGGDVGANSVAWWFGGASVDIIQTLTGLFEFYSWVAIGNSGISTLTGNDVQPGYVSFDTFLPNMVYIQETNAAEGVTTYVVNATDLLFKLVMGVASPESLTVFGGDVSLKGWQTLKDMNVTFSGLPTDAPEGYIENAVGQALGGFTALENAGKNQTGDFGMDFNLPNGWSILMSAGGGLAGRIAAITPAVGTLFQVLSHISTLDSAAWIASAAVRMSKNFQWAEGEDPLIIDLDGDGIETIGIRDAGVYFDIDNDLFAELSGWVRPDDGFLVRDLNDNDRIDNRDEMFGGNGAGGFDDLEVFDQIANGGNADGAITGADAIWAELRIWRDLNTDGFTDNGELFTLDELGIVSLSLNNEALEDFTTPQGAELLSFSFVEFEDGLVSRLYEAIFETSNTATVYAGEGGRAPWQADLALNASGYGSITDLAIAAANDPALGQIVADASAAMTVPKLLDLREAVGPVLDYWGQTLETTRELTPVLLETTGDGMVSLADVAVYTEDATGGLWTLASGNPITDAGGTVIDRPTIEDVLAQAVSVGQTWQIEQTWTPVSRSALAQFRDEAPYLARIVDGRAIIDDYGIQNADGSWRLASGREITDEGGNVIAAPTVADILALSRNADQEWRVEEIGFNPYADIEVERIGVRFTDGIPIDYTVEVTDQDGAFLVWARNLDRALELQFKTGDSREFNLRNYEIDLDTLDEVGSSFDSTYRVEVFTPGQFQFATSLGGVDFRKEMLTATLDNDTGLIDYKVIEGGSYTLSEDRFESIVDPMIDLIGLSMQQYISMSLRLSVRLALQDGLSDFARGIEYDVDLDRYVATTDRGLAPMYEAILEAAPATNDDDAIYDYLQDWSFILAQVYPDYKPADPKFIFDTAVELDQTSMLQYILAAYETVQPNIDVFAVANALSIDEQRIIIHDETDTDVVSQPGVNFFYLTGGNQNVVGSYEADAQVFTDDEQTDVYYIGANAGDDIILDRDLGDTDQIRFTQLRSDEVRLVRDGEDLIIFYNDDANFIRLTDQFLGERNIILQNGTRVQSGVDSLIFADGQVYDRYRMSFEVVDFDRAALDEADAYFGSGSGDILFGGLGNDFLSGGAGGDTYIYQRGDGQDVIDDLGNFSFGPVQAGLDFLMFQGDITEDDMRLTRDGDSDDLLIELLDAEGNLTGDSIELVGQFGGVRLNLGGFSEAIGADDGLDYIAPNLIEKIIFERGAVLDFTEIVERVLANARTENDDAIYGLLNDNTLDGGAGDDFLTGLEGFDTYLFGLGYGSDVIFDNDFSSILFGSKDDELVFLDGIEWTDINFLRDGSSDTLTLEVAATGDQAILPDYLEVPVFLVGYTNLIEEIQWGDGTVWSHLKLLQHYIDRAKTDGDDVIYGFETISDRIDGGLGNDRLEGFSSNDTYVFAAGYGADTVLDTDGSDRIEFVNLNSDDVSFSRTALDLIITIDGSGDQIILENQYVRENQQRFAVEIFQFDDRARDYTDFNPEDIDLVGTSAGEVIEGSNFAEKIDGRAGDDTLIGRDGGDIYVFDVGYGADVIVDVREKAAWRDRPGILVPEEDVVEFGSDITQANVVFTKDGNDLVVSITDRTDTLRIRNQFLDLDNGIERFEFSDGTFLSIADIEELLQIEGGNRGDNLIVGNPTSPNTLDGRQGDDTLVGGTAADIYAFGADFDFDRIEEAVDADGVLDLVQFGASVTRDALRISRNGDDLIIDLGNGADVLTIAGGLADTSVEQFRFGDGTILTLEEIIDQMLTGTDGNEVLSGLDNRDDTITSGAGSDAMEGRDGNDTYRWGYGDENDSISDTAGIDRLEFGPTITENDVRFEEINGTLLITLPATNERIAVIGGYSSDVVELFVFEDGTELSIQDVRLIVRDSQSNFGQEVLDTRLFDTGIVLDPGPGNDDVILGDGAQVLFLPGGGTDRFVMAPGATEATIRLPATITDDVQVRISDTSSDDLIIRFPFTGEQLVIVGALGTGAIPKISFANADWGREELVQAAIDGQSSAGNDVIFASDRDDFISAGRGDDNIEGGRGDDTYQFVRGDGQDVIEDDGGFDTLVVVGYQPADVRVERFDASRDDLIITFDLTDDAIIVRNAVIDQVEFSDGTIWTRDTLLDLANAVGTEGDDRLVGTPGAEIFRPGLGNDLIVDGRGEDVYIFAEGDGQDRITTTGAADGFGTIRFGASIVLEDVTAKRDADGNLILLVGTGDDRITLIDPVDDPDAIVGTLEFADGRTQSIADLAAAIPATAGDDHKIVPSGAPAALDEPGFNLFGREGNDTLEGGRGDDILQGDEGNDLLQGHSGSDTYVFGLGDGQDVVLDIDELADGAIDTIRFEAGIAPGDITFLTVGPTDLVIGIAGTEDRLTIRNLFASGDDAGLIEAFAFASGETWDLTEIVARAGQGGPDDDVIDVGTAVDVDASFAGAGGDDLLAGGRGDSTYLFNPGDGRDVVFEAGSWATSADTVVFGSGFDLADMLAVQVGDDLLIRFLGSDDRLLVRDQFATGATRIETFLFNDGASLSAAGMAATLTSEDAVQRLLNPSTPDTDPFVDPLFDGAGGGSGGGSGGGGSTGGTPDQARTLTGTDGVVDTYEFFVPELDDAAPLTTITNFETGDLGDVLDIRLATGLVGTVVARQEGSDTYVFFVDEGIHDLSLARQLIRLEGVALADMTLGNFNGAPFETTEPQDITGTSANETLSGGWGDDSITAGGGEDELEGEEGNDFLRGAAQSDVYLFNAGFGQDTVSDNGAANGSPADVIRFGPGIDPAGLIVETTGVDMILSFAGTNDRITIERTLDNTSYRIESVEFDDGTVFTHAQLVALATATSDADQELIGSYNVETLDGGAGNDTINPLDGEDLVIGGPGNDLLSGGDQNDTFRFDAGFGQDILSEAGWSNNSGADIIEFGPGISPADLLVRVDEADLILSFIGSEDRIVISNTMTVANNRVETVRFDDGTTLSHAQLVAIAFTPDDGDASIVGGYDAEDLGGGGGNDTIDGGEGADTLTGGPGNDLLIGNEQNDFYRFDIGFGQDIISDNGWSNNSFDDVIEFGPGLLFSDFRVVEDQGDLILSFAGSDDEIRIAGTVNNADFRIEEVRFNEGLILSHADLLAIAFAPTPEDQRIESGYDADFLESGAGNDTILGRDGDDTLVGGIGNDSLTGGEDNDTYRFDAGFGQDIVSDNGWSNSSGADVIQFGPGIAAADLRVRADGDDLVLTFFGSEDRIVLQNAVTNADFVIETLEFDDGTIVTHADLLASAFPIGAGNDILLGTSGDDTLDGLGGDDSATGINGNDSLIGGTGFDTLIGGNGTDELLGGDGNDSLEGNGGNDTLTGGPGNDTLRGGGNNDVYRFGTGFGKDLISEDGGWSAGNDTVEFDATIASTDVVVFTDGNDLVLVVSGTTDVLRIEGVNNSGRRIETFYFGGDDVTLTYNDIVATATPYPGPTGVVQQGDAASNLLVGGAGDDLVTGLVTGSLMQGGAGNDTLEGAAGDETLEGGTGNDALNGGEGNDVYRFSAGFGQDVIDDTGTNPGMGPPISIS